METPIVDFVRRYNEEKPVRAHMPGHKGKSVLGCEPFDLTEIAGADSLYAADGVIRASEKNAAALFGTGDTLYSAEGSSLCIRAMLYLARLARPSRAGRPTVIASRGAHKAFVQAAAMLDFEIEWLWPRSEEFSLCRNEADPSALEQRLAALAEPPAAVYVTSPDYLGGTADLAALAAVAHAHGVPLMVDNAHGAYLRFLPENRHPIALGADLCCDSAHKTLPALTGAAYLHIAPHAPESFRAHARQALALFGSTSPSYLILQSLDLLNRRLADGYPRRLAEFLPRVGQLRQTLLSLGWHPTESDPLKITVDARRSGYTGTCLAARLREGGVECEYADPDVTVLMLTPDNTPQELARIERAFAAVEPRPALERPRLTLPPPRRVLSPHRAVLAPSETVPTAQAVGRIAAAPTVSCPPAVPVAVSGEEISSRAVAVLAYYGVETVAVVAENRA